MDFLPAPPDPACHIRVPLLTPSTAAYDFNGFETYASRLGFNFDDTSDAIRSGEQWTTMMQTWLYFGLISECTGLVVDVDDFKAKPGPPSNITYVDGNALFEYLDRWIFSLRMLAEISERWQDSLSHATKVLRFATEASTWFDNMPSMHAAQYAAVAISVKALIFTMIQIHDNFLQPAETIGSNLRALRPWSLLHDRMIPYPARYLHSLMRESGWCPSLIRRICKRHSYANALFLLQSQPPQDPTCHARCTLRGCTALNVDVSTYQTQHIDKDCNCTFVAVDTTVITNIIESGNIPLISTTIKNETEVRISTGYTENDQPWRLKDSLDQFTFGIRGPLRSFVVISHVWADGLGNPKANSLPLCQFKRITDRVKRGGGRDHGLTVSPPWFWMDTFCIPVGQDRAETRLKAIDQMAMVYASAAYVLVLDNALAVRQMPILGDVLWDKAPIRGVKFLEVVALREPSKYLAASQMLTQILCSNWAGRSWTLQEAVLCDHVDFALAQAALTSSWLAIAALTGSRKMGDGPAEGRLPPSFMRLVQTPQAYFMRTVLASIGVCCVPQTYRKLSKSYIRRGRFVWDLCLLTAACLAATEIFVTLLSLGVAIVAIATALAIAAVAIIWPVLPIVGGAYAFDSWYHREQIEELVKERLRTNRLRDVLRMYLFRSLAESAGSMLRIDEKAAMSTARSFPETYGQLRCAQFSRVWESLAERSTSKADDVAYILGTLTQLRIQPLKYLSPEDRVLAIFRAFETLPVDLLFLPECVQGRNWIPITPGGDNIDASRTMRPVEEGFEIDMNQEDLDRISLRFAQATPLPQRFVVTAGKTTQYAAQPIMNSQALPSESVSSDEQIILYRSGALTRAGPEHSDVAAMFCVKSRTTGQLRLRFLCHLDWYRLSQSEPLQVHHMDAEQEGECSKCIVLDDSAADATAAPNGGVLHEKLALEHRPPFPIDKTLAHSTLSILVYLNSTPLYAYCMYVVLTSDVLTLPGRIVLAVALSLLWFGLLAFVNAMGNTCRTISYEAHYGAVPTKPRGKLWLLLSDWLEQWDAAIVTNFKSSKDRPAATRMPTQVMLRRFCCDTTPQSLTT